jgi:hypothetical protein
MNKDQKLILLVSLLIILCVAAYFIWPYVAESIINTLDIRLP